MRPGRSAARSTPRDNASRASRHASVPEVVELERNPEVRLAQQLHDGLQFILLLATDPHLIALQTRLYLELGVLDQARNLLARLLVDTVPQDQLLLRGRKRNLRLLHLEACDVDAALRQSQLQDLEHLLQLEVDLCVRSDGELLQLEARAGVLEVKTLRQLTIGLVHSVRDFVNIELRDDIE